MAPAPTRTPRPRTPGAWGVPVGATLMVAGVVAAIVIVAVGAISFASDVDRLVRTGSGGELVADLEAGEYLLYDEDDGIDLGPLDVRITRISDGLGVVPTDVDDGPSYDIAGNSGSAALSFDLPSAGDYRIETTTGVGRIASFAVGRDVGDGPLASLTQGLLGGGVLFLAGLALLIWGAVQRSRARLRSRAAAALDHGRSAVESTAEAIDDPDRRRHVATHHGRRVSQTAAERAGNAPAPVRDGFQDAAGRAETVVGDLAASTEAPSELVGRLGDSLGRAQERLAAGESLRTVARDGASELRELGTDARSEASTSYAATRGAAADARAEVEARRTDLVATRDELTATAGDEAARNLVAAERAAEETGAEISAALDNAASDITAAAMRSAGAVNEEAKAAIDAASAELRAASALSSAPAVPRPPSPPTGPMDSASPPAEAAMPVTRSAAPPAPDAVPVARRSHEPSPTMRHEGVDLGAPVPLAPPPAPRVPVGPRMGGRSDAPSYDGALTDAGTEPEPAATSTPRFAALSPPPRALVRAHVSPRAAEAGVVEHSEPGSRRRDELSAPAVAPPPSGRRPDPSSGPGAAVPPG